MYRISVESQSMLLPHFLMPDDATPSPDASPAPFPWISDLLGVLPASAFLDAVDAHRRLHICQLVGTVPLWSWTVTPTAYKTLLGTNTARDDEDESSGDGDEDEVRPCHLDGFGQTPSWTATDGSHGFQHVVANAETLRRCLSVSPRRTITNADPSLRDGEARIHRLEVIRVSPRPTGDVERYPSPTSRITLGGLRVDSTARLATIVTSGWVILAGCLGAAVKTHHFLGAAYLVIVTLTGLCVQILHGSQPRALRHGTPSGMDRMVVVAEHANATSWKVFYGDSALLKSLLRHPLTSEYSSLPSSMRRTLRVSLRGLVLAQWAVALTAAAKKDGNGVLISFWVLVSLVTSRYLATPAMGAQIWMRSYAGVVMERYRLKLSCRLSLLSTLVALNPETPPYPSGEDAGTAAASRDPMGWLDTVWRDGSSRRHWEESVRRALTETFQKLSVAKVAASGHKNDFWQSLGFAWQGDSKGENESVDRTLVAETEEEEWTASIQEGLTMAARIQAEAERLVARGKGHDDTKS